jgi:CheY-like chemotaxis protein
MPTILVVDDDAVDRELACRSLGPAGDLEVHTAARGAKALEILAREPPDLILTDLRMPGMDGLQLVEHIREDYPVVPVILMTSQGSEQLAVRALRSGATSYVPKRDLREHLPATLREVLDLAQTRRGRKAVMRYLTGSEAAFELVNDPDLIMPVVGFFQDGLDRLGFGAPALRTQVGMALMEALSNSMIHGNLEVRSELREDRIEDYEALIQRRRGEEPFASRRLRCSAHEGAEKVVYTVEDQGPGFDPDSLPDPTTPENMGRLHGRGLLLIRTFMDEVSFNQSGNHLTMTKKL